MAKTTQIVYVSDISGEALRESEAVTVTVKHPDRRTQELDMSLSEWSNLVDPSAGRWISPRGRKPGTKVARKTA